ncbi:MAG: DNRLRE domain-containing protein, partial [Acidobacteria bacterium]
FSATLSAGTHVVTASVTDSGGLGASDAVTVTVTAGGGQTVVTLTSIALEDGWLRESNENSNVGGRATEDGTGASALRAGDQKKDRQFKALVSFDTSSIPDGATIVSATLRLRRGTVVGTNPFTTHGTCWVDVRSGGFGGSTDLHKSDFEAAATVAKTTSLSSPAANGDWAEGDLDPSGLAAIDKTGTTQLRIYFDLDDNDDGGNDYVGFYSGDNANAANHPQLVVTYQ